MPALKKYSIVAQASDATPYTVSAYSGSDLSAALAISQAENMPEGSYGWMQLCGDVRVRTPGGTQTAYVDFRPNDARLQLSSESSEGSGGQSAKLPPGVLDDKTLAHGRHLRLSQLPPLLIEAGPYCSLLREARDVFVDGHFYACVAMCGISFERFQRDKAKPYGATRKHKMWEVRKLLQSNNVLNAKTVALCERMADLRNDYAHGHGHSPKKDALRALTWMHRFIRNETDLMRHYKIVEGILHRRRPKH
ncbi:hypothetical protein LCGC14_1488300 [marine sediment metagenome]|uniref:DUF4145 domain-containing protein n=1 Tax=marine sediment metagenome TaxID=412755 RepID=A0A0F9JTC3_9ZZZZ